MDTIMNQGLGSSLGSLLVGRLADAPVRKEKESSEYEGKATHEILDPELNLNRLGYTAGDAIDWNEISLPEKKNLYLELYARITNFTNADCKVYIDNEEFNCHLIVLQCYSEVFHTYVAVKKVELPSDKCSAASFAFIYEWMITGDPSYRELNRENVLDIFNAAKYLKIRDLIEQCWAFIDNQEVFSEDTAFLLYVDAKEKNLPEVRELMLPRIQKFFLMLVSSQDWLELELEDVQNFLQSNYICVNCEMEIFMSAVRWLKHDWENRDQHKVQLLSCVRFGNIAPWQLVDIKRNPDNPDFKELAKDPDICKMIDDGLAFVIIKYWYGQENDDYQHWNSILALKEPPPRNWSGMDKTYFTYREFLIYLDQYRRNQMIEKSKPKERKRRPMHELKPTPKSSTEKLTPKMPTMDEFLSTRKSPLDVIFSPRSVMAPRTKHPAPFRKYMSKQRAATVIQAAFRSYITRKRLRAVSLLTTGRRKRSSYDRAYQLAKERSGKTDSYYKSDSLERLSVKPSQKLMSMLMTNLGPERQKVYSYSQMNKISSSIIQPRGQYFETSSLFLAERESVMVFGGIDPHSGYGAGRNTGKDIFRYLPDSNVWEYIGEMPAPRNHHNVAFLTGRVYVVGGSDPREDELRGKSTVVDTVWSFDPIKKNWFSEGSLKARRKNFGLVVSKHCMFAIGGQDKHGRTIASVEKYNPMVGVWESQAPMNHPRMGVACTKHNDKIWAAGGMSGSRRKPLTDCVECYDIERNQWTEINRLRFPRCFSSLFSMSDRLYLIGGAGKIKIKDKTTSSVKEIDIWNEDTREWEYKTEMAIPRHGHCVAYLGTQILIIGGVTTVYMRALSNTECYCTSRGTWVRGIACLPTTLSGHATCWGVVLCCDSLFYREKQQIFTKFGVILWCKV
ncbi:Kelch motif [Popillia japonica]